VTHNGRSDDDRDELARHLSQQSIELFSHLPKNEVSDGEHLAFKTDLSGNLLVATGTAIYKLEGGIAWRLRSTAEGQEMSTWKNRRQLRRAILAPGAGGAAPPGFN
jgi:hypothetical protein